MTPEPERDVVERLLPCPFCGAVEVFPLGHPDDGAGASYAECTGCGATGPDASVAAWNRRTALAASAAQSGVSGGEALREAFLAGFNAGYNEEDGMPDADGAWRKHAAVLATPPAETDSGATLLGRYGHHPEPPIDFCIEVQRLEGELFEVERGIRPAGTITEDFQRAMDFRVGGDEGCVSAKVVLRALEPRIKALQHPGTTTGASGQAVAQEPLRVALNNDMLLFEQMYRRMHDCWIGTGSSYRDGDASNDYRIWRNEAGNRAQHLRWLLRHSLFDHPAPSAASVRAEVNPDTERLDYIEKECRTLRCQSYPTAGGDDADVGWEVVGHWMAKPQERILGQGNTPRAAIDRALQTPHASREGRADG